MSTDLPYGDPETRKRILDAALDLSASVGPSMRLADVAKAAGVSHQGLYLHFRGRDALLVALLGHMVESFGLVARSDTILHAADGAETVSRLVQFAYTLNLHLDEIGWVLEEAQHLDEAFGRDWRNRAVGLRDFIQKAVVERLDREGALQERWSPADACDLVLGMTSLGTWRTFVRELGWQEEAYVDSVTRMILTALT